VKTRFPEGGAFRVTPDQDDRRLDRVLRGLFGNVPLAGIMKSIRNGSVRVNGARADGGLRLSEGDEVTFPWADETRADDAHSGPERQIRRERLVTLFRNDCLWCVEKPAGLLSQPDRAGGDSLITRAWSELLWERRDFRPALLGRLDRNVSGVEAIVLNAPALRILSETMRSGGIEKTYRAIVLGVAPQEGEISLPLLKDGRENFVRPASREDGGRDALTRFRRLGSNGRYSLLEVRLITGRPHQARAHLAAAGHPIAGDVKYGSERGTRRRGRLFLHAYSLAFQNLPVIFGGTEKLVVRSPLPEEFSMLM
jgi:23S rRNA pseudouridine955/2504/2580 synthase